MYDLVGVDGNAYSVIGYVMRAMRQCKKTKAEIDDYQKDAMSGDYNNLLEVSVAMIDALNKLRGDERRDDE
jgi:hypothetical protein